MSPTLIFDYNSSVLEVDQKIVLGDIKKVLDMFSPEIILVGREEEIKRSEQFQENLENKVEIRHAGETLGMDEKPKRVFRKPDNSILVCKQLLSSGEGDVMISGGNSGGVVAVASYDYQRRESELIHKLIERAFAYCNFPRIPLTGPKASLCDVGAKTDTQPTDLLKYALLLGEELKSSGITEPQLPLLNIGTEPGKGTQLYQDAYQLFKKANLPGFVGNAEAEQVYFDQNVHGFILDGFSGNQVLKMAEATYKFMLAVDKEMGASDEDIKKKEMIIALEVGAILLGVKNKVVLGHGKVRPLPVLIKGIQYAQRKVDYDQIHDKIEQFREFLS